MNDSSHHHRQTTRRKSNSNNIHRSTSNNSKRKRPSFTIKLDRHHLGLLRFVVLIVGFGAVGTFLLEGSSSFPLVGSDADHHPIRYDNHHHHHPHHNHHDELHRHHQSSSSFFFNAKRQLSYWGVTSSSTTPATRSSNSIAAQVRSQMEQKIQSPPAAPKTKTGGGTNPTASKSSTTTTTMIATKVGEEFADIAAQVRAQIEEQGLLNRSIIDSPDGGSGTNGGGGSTTSSSGLWFLDEDEEDEDFEIPLIGDDDQLLGANGKTATNKRRQRQRQKGGKRPGGRNKSRPPPPEEGMPDLSHAPPPRDLDPNDSFSACLLIKDDNHWLIEWIAFHYHVMPLRRLIVAIDPDSQTTPKNILGRWDQFMNITTWTDDDFMKGQPVPTNMIKAYKDNKQLMFHRHRQNTFYIKCLQFLQKEGRPWVHLTDTDEFIAINYASGPLYNLTKHHPIQQPGSVLRFLNHHQEATNDIPNCIFMPRYMFGNKESSKGLVERNVPKRNPILRGKSFLTQRYMFRHPKKMQNGKNLVHLSAIGGKLNLMANVHRVSSSCPTHDEVADVNHIKTTLVKVHHYLGSKEQYFFRMDPRGENNNNDQNIKDNSNNKKQQQVITKGLGTYFQRDSDRYEQLNGRAIYSDSGARGWIKGFVDEMGISRAEFLLKDIGKVGVQ